MSASDPTDEELARRAANGDPAAFDELMQRYGLRLIGFLNELQVADPDDAAQDVWLKAWRSLGTFTREREDGQPHHFRGWLFTLARRKAEDRRKKRRPTAIDPEVILLHADPKRVSEPDARTKLTECLDLLPPQFRQLLVGRMDEASYEKLAAALDMKVGTVKSGINRGRILLAQCLGPYAE